MYSVYLSSYRSMRDANRSPGRLLCAATCAAGVRNDVGNRAAAPPCHRTLAIPQQQNGSDGAATAATAGTDTQAERARRRQPAHPALWLAD